MIERIETGVRASKIVKHNGTIYFSGQVCEDPTDVMKGQTQTTLAKVDALLHQAGSDREHVLSAIIYLKTMDDFAAMNEVWNAWVPEGFAPARACVRADMARDALLVEISIIAAEKK